MVVLVLVLVSVAVQRQQYLHRAAGCKRTPAGNVQRTVLLVTSLQQPAK